MAAVHGKLIGGGVALSLATDLRVAANAASFNFGNLPRGMNPLFMLSRSLPSVVGDSSAMVMYLDDMILPAATALQSGILSAIGNTVSDAKALACN